eukprot:scaffold74185_cov25-Attheya_sp.AAC.1
MSSSEPTSYSQQTEEAIDGTTAIVSFIIPANEYSVESTATKTANAPLPTPLPPPRRVASTTWRSSLSSSFNNLRLSATGSSSTGRRRSSAILDDRIYSLLEFDHPKENTELLESSSSIILPPEAEDVAAPSYIPTNLNVYWLLLTLLAVWFLFIFTPHALVKRGGVGQDAPLVIHMLGIYFLYVACINNTIMTPSTTFVLGGKQTARPFHIFIGRFGMISGICSMISGLVLAWNPMREFPRHHAIVATVVGAIQVSLQVVGYSAIKRYQQMKREISDMDDERSTTTTTTAQEDTGGDRRDQLKIKCKTALKLHIICMVGIFVVPCSGAAMLRLGIEFFFTLILVIVIWPCYSYYVYLRKLNKPTPIVPEVETGAEDEIQSCKSEMMVVRDHMQHDRGPHSCVSSTVPGDTTMILGVVEENCTNDL